MKRNKYISKERGEMDFLIMILIFLVALFAIWVLAGGPKTSQEGDKPFIKPYTDQTAPLQTYGNVN